MLKVHEFELTVEEDRRGLYSWWNRTFDVEFCNGEFRHFWDIPKEITKVTLRVAGDDIFDWTHKVEYNHGIDDGHDGDILVHARGAEFGKWRCLFSWTDAKLLDIAEDGDGVTVYVSCDWEGKP